MWIDAVGTIFLDPSSERFSAREALRVRIRYNTHYPTPRRTLLDSAILALEDGTVFEGRSFGAPAERSGEVVFNTALTGYQEIFTDPSYSGQIVILTNPQIGNYGTSVRRQRSRQALHRRSRRPRILRASPATGARMTKPAQFLAQAGIPVISDLDTRALVRHLRTRGVMRGVLSAIEKDAAKLVEKARSIPIHGRSRSRQPRHHARAATSGRSRRALLALGAHRPRRPSRSYHVVAYDFGIKHNILRRLVHVGLPRHRGPGAHLRRRRARAQARRRLPLERPRRSRAAARRRSTTSAS